MLASRHLGWAFCLLAATACTAETLAALEEARTDTGSVSEAAKLRVPFPKSELTLPRLINPWPEYNLGYKGSFTANRSYRLYFGDRTSSFSLQTVIRDMPATDC